MQSFEDRWADPKFKARATAFLRKFVGTDHQPIDNPALLCRKERQLDGQEASPDEVRALELALVFAFLDGNPKRDPDKPNEGSWMVTAENAELHQWPIDIEHGHFTTTTGGMVQVKIHDRRKNHDSERVLSPPLDLHMPIAAPSPDALVLTGIYETVLGSLHAPSKNCTADRVRIAVDWFAKAWCNTATVHEPERLVFLKTAFEALTGTGNAHKSACKLRRIFEALPDATAEDSDILVWSPEEKPIHTRTWTNKSGEPQTCFITDLEDWFMKFSKARNEIIHEGKFPPLTYSGSNPNYNGPFVCTAEFLLRGAIKALLSLELGYEDAWRTKLFRTIAATL